MHEPHVVGAPAAELHRVSARPTVTRRRPSSRREARGRAEQLAGDRAARSGSTTTPRSAGHGAGLECGRRDGAEVRRVIERGVQRAALAQDRRRRRAPARRAARRAAGDAAARRSITCTGPTQVGLRGLAPRAGAEIGRGRRRGCGRPGPRPGPRGSTLHGSQSRSARREHRRAGRPRPAPSRRRARSAASSVRAVEREVAHAGRGTGGRAARRARDRPGRCRRRRSCGRRARGRTGPRGAIARGERLGGGERVGAGERGVGDEHAADVDAAVEAPRDRLAQRVLGGGRAEREHA